MPPGLNFAKVWETKASSDVTLLVYLYCDGDGKPEPVAKLALHAIILATASPHFETQLHGAWQTTGPGAEDGPPASGSGSLSQPAAKRPKTVDPRTSGKVLELTCFPGEPHSVPEAVMRHAYTGTLPDDPTILAWAIRRADYLVMHATVEACVAQLQELSDGGQLTVQHVIDISSVFHQCTLDETHEAAVQQAVASVAAKVLSSQLGSARQVLVDQQLLGQFVQLPIQLLKQWAMLDSLQVESENTMAVLITAWYDHQLDSAAPATATTAEQQCKELSALLCLNKLTASFHLQAMHHLKWYKAPACLAEQHAVVRMLGVGNVGMHPGCKAALASGGAAGRQQGPAKAEQQWSLSRQQLETLWADKDLLLDGDIHLAGFSFTAQLELRPDPESEQLGQGDRRAQQYALGLFLAISWPEVLIKHGVGAGCPHPCAEVQADVRLGEAAAVQPGRLLVGASTYPGAVIGWLPLATQEFSRVDELALFMATQPCVSFTLEVL